MPNKSILKIDSTTIILAVYSKQKEIKTKNILTDEKNRIKMLSLHNHELMGKIKEHEGKNICWLTNICSIKN